MRGKERLETRQRGYEEGYRYGMEIGKTLNPKIKQGEWIVKEGVVACYTACNKCGYADYNHKRPNFCPNCGADMRKDGIVM